MHLASLQSAQENHDRDVLTARRRPCRAPDAKSIPLCSRRTVPMWTATLRGRHQSPVFNLRVWRVSRQGGLPRSAARPR